MSKSDFSEIFFSHFFSSPDSFLKFSRSRLQINAKDACSGSLSGLAFSVAASNNPFSGLSSGTLKKSSLCVSRRSASYLAYILLDYVAAKAIIVNMGGDKLS